MAISRRKLTKGNYTKRWNDLMEKKKRLGITWDGKCNLSYSEWDEINFLENKYHFKRPILNSSKETNEKSN